MWQSLLSKVLRGVRESWSSWSWHDSLDLLTVIALELIWMALMFASGAVR